MENENLNHVNNDFSAESSSVINENGFLFDIKPELIKKEAKEQARLFKEQERILSDALEQALFIKEQEKIYDNAKAQAIIISSENKILDEAKEQANILNDHIKIYDNAKAQAFLINSNNKILDEAKEQANIIKTKKKIYDEAKEQAKIIKDDYDKKYKKIHEEADEQANLLFNKQGKLPSKKVEKPKYYSSHKTNTKALKIVIIVVTILIVLFFGILFVKGLFSRSTRYRTFMIYMVGSDLESSGAYGSYDLADISAANINLKENNVILMVGGAKKWHNFVNKDEVAMYELTEGGFKKVKSYELSSMGGVNHLENFLDYAYTNYKAEHYDMIFWNHGLGAMAIEQDEIYNRPILLTELDEAFRNSPFNEEKLEVVIFNNCLAGNIHFASIMKNYAQYMVGSEESFYVSSYLDRLNFIEDVQVTDGPSDVGMRYINRSDQSIVSIEENFDRTLDTTLALIDLSKIDLVETEVNNFFSSIDLDEYYYRVSAARSNSFTYGIISKDFDLVDILEFAYNLRPFADENSFEALAASLDSAVLYNSTNNNHSNGLSIYFPFYGSSEYKESGIELFRRMWNNDEYVNFISDYYDINNGYRRARRSGQSDVLKMENNIEYNGDNISIVLSDKEREEYQRANIYVFEKRDDNYYLLLKSSKGTLTDNVLSFSDLKVLTTDNNYKVSLSDGDSPRIKGAIDDIDVIANVGINGNDVTLNDFILDSGDLPSSGIVEREDNSELSLYILKYNLYDNGMFDGDFAETVEKEKIQINSNQLKLVNDISNTYVLVEMYDINNDVLYSNLLNVE